MIKIKIDICNIGNHVLLHNSILNLEPGSLVALYGTSGIGKSVLLKQLSDIYPKNIIFLSQNFIEHSSTFFTIEEIILNFHKNKKFYQFLQEKLYQTNLLKLKKKLLINLSGGQKQVICLLHILHLSIDNNIPIILIDEPLSALDNITKILILEILIDFLVLFPNKTILFSNHDMMIVPHFVSKIYLLQDKQIFDITLDLQNNMMLPKELLIMDILQTDNLFLVQNKLKQYNNLMELLQKK